MVKRYVRLNYLMDEKGVDRLMIAKEIGKSISYVNQRFAGNESWEVEHCYQILAMLDESGGELTQVFPPQGLVELTPLPLAADPNAAAVIIMQELMLSLTAKEKHSVRKNNLLRPARFG